MNFYWKFTSNFGKIFVLQSLLSIVSFAHYASFDAQLCAQPRAYNDNEDAYVRLPFNARAQFMILLYRIRSTVRHT